MVSHGLSHMLPHKSAIPFSSMKTVDLGNQGPLENSDFYCPQNLRARSCEWETAKGGASLRHTLFRLPSVVTPDNMVCSGLRSMMQKIEHAFWRPYF
ncbi:hypothetical protein AVEN_239224-1 [Araneus ventricosus]|uniref:Uncharacterized protein n=1 Tax=Araneus ventricosus TaxID=182803 RepID=A0A4Y2JMG9_ARAVE|nr:hypothetical protein AVEN_239224-1 [Araneus ventricosus]